MARLWCEPDPVVVRRWSIAVDTGAGVGPTLAWFTGTEAELVEWIPHSGEFCWEWVR